MSQWDSRTTMAAGLREAMGSGSRIISKGALIWMRTKGLPVVKDGKGTGSLVERTSPINNN